MFVQVQVEEAATLVEIESPQHFTETDFIRSLVGRAELYLSAGFPVHLRGTSGSGKTTLALHLARRANRPVMLIHGDEEHTTSHLVGGQNGYSLRRVADNYIRSVRKYDEDYVSRWVDDRITVACKLGCVLLYDEFNRSRPEANNVLLSILQEGVLSMPSGRNNGESFLRVHPQFRAIFTSNSEEYAGVHRTQDALRERMVTLDLGHFDRDTELAVTRSHAPGLHPRVYERVVDLVRAVRACEEFKGAPTVRSCIKIARALERLDLEQLSLGSPATEVLWDVLASGCCRSGDPQELARLRTCLVEVWKRSFAEEAPPS